MKRIYLFNIVAWNYRKKIGFPVCKNENFAGLQAHQKRGKSARASPTPHHSLNEERSVRFTAQPLSALLYNSNLPLTRGNFYFPTDHFLYNFTLENSNFFLFPLKVRIIGSRLYSNKLAKDAGHVSNNTLVRVVPSRNWVGRMIFSTHVVTPRQFRKLKKYFRWK